MCRRHIIKGTGLEAATKRLPPHPGMLNAPSGDHSRDKEELMRPVPPTLTYIGIAVAAAGFAVIMFAWGRVGALTAVPLQMPYLLSGGLTGLGLILTGLTLINVNAKRQDTSARDRQLGQVREVLTEIKALLAGEDGSDKLDELLDDQTDQLPPITPERV